MTVKLLTEHHLEFLSLKESLIGSSVSIHVKISHFGNHMRGAFRFVMTLEVLSQKSVSSRASIKTASTNSVESDLGCTSRVYFDNVTLTSQKPCQHNNMCDCSETNGYNILL